MTTASAEIPKGFRDTRGCQDDSELTCDVCVIGSGAAGTTVALRLLEAGRSVLLLESGGGTDEPATSALNEFEATELPISGEARVRALGGTTSVWWGGSAVLPDSDFASRPWLECTGWPIQPPELTSYYSQACRLLEIPDLTSVALDRFADRRGFLVRSDDLDTVVLFWPRHPRRFRDLLEPAVQREPGLEVYLFANVTRIVTEASGQRVDRVDVQTVTARRLTVHPKVLVLACGGIENARLLLASGGRGLGNDRDVVGRYYMDHPKGVAGAVRMRGSEGTLIHPAYWDGRPGHFRLGIRLSPDRQRREALLGGYLRFHPILAAQGSGIEALRQLRRRGGPTVSARTIVRDLALGMPELARFARFKLTNRGAVASAEIHNFIEQRPMRHNRVRLSDRLDRFGDPLARVDWSIDEMERRTMRRLHALLDEEIGGKRVGRVDSPLLAGEDDPWPIASDASHHMGTTRMGLDPSTSAVDADGRIHGISNLFVAGSSVFPTGGSVNPTLTIVALSLRLADHVAETR